MLPSKLENQVTNLSADLQQCWTRNKTDENLLRVVRVALVLEKSAFQQRISMHLKEREKLVAARTAVDAVF